MEKLSEKNPCKSCKVDRQTGNPYSWQCECDRCLKPSRWKDECVKKLEKYEQSEEQYDKIMRVNTYLLEKYGDKIWEEFGIKKTGDAARDMFSAMKIFDEIYKREKEKYPLMWYEYALCNG